MALPNGHTPTIAGELPARSPRCSRASARTAVRDRRYVLDNSGRLAGPHLRRPDGRFAATVITGFVGLHLTVNDQAVDLPNLEVLEARRPYLLECDRLLADAYRPAVDREGAR